MDGFASTIYGTCVAPTRELTSQPAAAAAESQMGSTTILEYTTTLCVVPDLGYAYSLSGWVGKLITYM
jgi:hypothetical protein